jgi:hypothetical protein
LPVGLMLLAWLFDALRKVTANPPQVIVQKIDDGPPKVIQVIQPPKA